MIQIDLFFSIVAKPFCEVSVVQRVTSPIFTQFRYLAVLIQEFHVQVELPFIFTIIDVLTPPSDSPQDSAAGTLYSVSSCNTLEPIKSEVLRPYK